MSALHFAAWGSLDIETMDRFQRRNMLRKIRAELAEHKIELEVGGHTGSPFYALRGPNAEGKPTRITWGNKFPPVCLAALNYINHGNIHGDLNAQPAG